DLIGRQIAAGEFGPAAAAIARLPSVELRDSWYARLAQAQSRAGARNAALATTSSIESDQLYSEALRELATQPAGALGGGPQADFESLIELITTTIAPQTWDDVGGPGAIDGFEGGVYVDAAGLMSRMPQ